MLQTFNTTCQGLNDCKQAFRHPPKGSCDQATPFVLELHWECVPRK